MGGKNNKITAQKGRKEFVVAGTFTFLGIHFVFSTTIAKNRFQEEFIDFIKKYGIEYDENYIWK